MLALKTMRQAITTKYLGPTNSRGARVKAYCEAGSVTVSWDDGLDIEANHVKACLALMKKLGWSYLIAGGGIRTGYVFVNVSDIT